MLATEQLPLNVRIETWVTDLIDSLQANYLRRYPDSPDPVTFRSEGGRKYWKIIQNDGGVHAFIDKKTGEVYKPASWKSPAKHVRFDMRLIKDRTLLNDPNFTDWAGGYLYMR